MQLTPFGLHHRDVSPHIFKLARVSRFALPAACIWVGLTIVSSTKAYAEGRDGAAANTLPNAPSALLPDVKTQPMFGQNTPNNTPKPDVAKKYHRVIDADQQAVPLSSKDKFVLAFADRVSLTSIASSALSAEYGFIRNDVPHYGTNLPAFGQRFGAAELKSTSESIFSYGLYASIFHDDPRYYVMGRREKIVKRAVYSASRVVITRNDDGDDVVNWPKLAGITSAAALTNAYYPQQDRRFGRTATSVLSSIAVTAGVNELHEFIGDVRHLVFHKHQDGDNK